MQFQKLLRSSVRLLLFGAFLLPTTTLAGGFDLAPKAPPPPMHKWEVYFGAFGGDYYNYNHTESTLNYADLANRSFQFLDETDLGMSGFFGGGLVGFLYHINPQYQVGGEFSASSGTGAAEKQVFVAFPGNVANPAVLSGMKTTLSYIFDLALKFGMSITPQTRVTVKLGPAFSSMKINGSVEMPAINPTPASAFTLAFTRTKSLFGVVFGLGLIRDINDTFSVFAEYNYHYFGQETFAGISGSRPGLLVSFNSSATAQAMVHSVKVGALVRFSV